MKIIKKIKVDKGWSNDKKYIIFDENKNKYFLKISKINEKLRKLLEFENTQLIHNLDVKIPKPIKLYEEKNKIYLITEYIDGKILEEIIDNYSKKEQYKLGLKAGKYLKLIHSIKPLKVTYDWANFYNEKIERKLKNYYDSNINYENINYFINIIEKKRNLIKKRPIRYQHGDFHIGNMMIDKN